MREKTVSKKENLFAASRFVLPEHREMYLRIKAEQARWQPRRLDEEQQALVSEQLWLAFQQQAAVTLTYTGEDCEERRFGCIAHIDQPGQRIKLAGENGNTWIPFRAILDVTV